MAIHAQARGQFGPALPDGELHLAAPVARSDRLFHASRECVASRAQPRCHHATAAALASDPSRAWTSRINPSIQRRSRPSKQTAAVEPAMRR